MLPALENLTMGEGRLSFVRVLDEEFPQLKTLILSNNTHLKTVYFKGSLLPHLVRLDLRSCANLTTLQLEKGVTLPMLDVLDISRTHLKSVFAFPRQFPDLRMLKADGFRRSDMPTLFSKLPELQSLSMVESKLEMLDIWGHVFANLQTLVLQGSSKLETVFFDTEDMEALNALYLGDCASLKLLMATRRTVFPALEVLDISNSNFGELDIQPSQTPSLKRAIMSGNPGLDLSAIQEAFERAGFPVPVFE